MSHALAIQKPMTIADQLSAWCDQEDAARMMGQFERSGYQLEEWDNVADVCDLLIYCDDAGHTSLGQVRFVLELGVEPNTGAVVTWQEENGKLAPAPWAVLCSEEACDDVAIVSSHEASSEPLCESCARSWTEWCEEERV